MQINPLAMRTRNSPTRTTALITRTDYREAGLLTHPKWYDQSWLQIDKVINGLYPVCGRWFPVFRSPY